MTRTPQLCTSWVGGHPALGAAMPWLQSAGDARLPMSTGLVAHRHYRARNDATGVSPAQTKCSETSSAVRSREWIWFSLDRIESEQLENTANYQSVLVSTCQKQDWLLFSQVISGIAALKSIALIAENAVIALKSMQLSVIYTSTNKPKVWLHRLNKGKNWTLILQGIYHTSQLPEAPQSCPSSIPSFRLVL